jgi:hypothetical protein
MAKKKQAAKKVGKNQQEQPAIRGSWPDPRSREEISHSDAETDVGKHSKNPDWKKKW